MKKRELLARIEALEARIALLEAQRFQLQPVFPLWPTHPNPTPSTPTWMQPNSGTPLPPLPIVTC